MLFVVGALGQMIDSSARYALDWLSLCVSSSNKLVERTVFVGEPSFDFD